MGLGDFHRYRRLVAAFALASGLLYTGLIPGHVISQATAFFLPDDFGAAVEMPCHEGMADTRDSSAPGEPSAPPKKCPFCKGYAAFMTALAGACDAGTLDAERAALRFAVFEDGQVHRVAGRTHNRGPPLEL